MDRGGSGWSKTRPKTSLFSSFGVGRAHQERSLVRDGGIVTDTTRPPELIIVPHGPNLLGETMIRP